MLANGIIGPYFVEDARGFVVIVTIVRYCDMVRNFFKPTIQNFPGYDDMI